MAQIKEIKIYPILDSNGFWSIEAKLILTTNLVVKASLSCGPNILDNQEENWKIAQRVIKQSQQTVLPAFLGQDIEQDFALVADNILQDLKKQHPSLLNKTTLLFSILSARVGARINKLKLYKHLNQVYHNQQIVYDLPTPIFTMFNGGIYADTNLDFEEYLLIPASKNKTSLQQKIVSADLIFQRLGMILKKAGFDSDTGGQGGYAPDLTSSTMAFDFIKQAIVESGFILKKDFALGVDFGAQHIYDPASKKYIFQLDQAEFVNDTLLNFYRDWLEKYDIIYLEDGLHPQDISGWESLTNQMRNAMIVAGDYLFNNKITELRKALKNHLANAVVVRLSQFNTILDCVEFIKLAQKHNYLIILSNDYSTTNDSFLADLAIANNVDYFKAGALTRGERVLQYNRLLEISASLNN